MNFLELFQEIRRTSFPEHPVVETPVGNYLYNPYARQYDLLPPVAEKKPVESRSVSTIESLIAVVLEESERRECPEGENMTVIFDLKGATFYPDDKEQHLQWRYNRTPSQQWAFLAAFLGRGLTHRQLVQCIQGLRPSIQNYADVFKAFRRITITDNSEMVSAPVIEDGNLGESYSFNMALKTGGEQKVGIPTGFSCIMPFIRGGEKEYGFDIVLDIERIQKDNRFQPSYHLNFIEKEVVEDTAIADEVALFRLETAGKSRILTALNYAS